MENQFYYGHPRNRFWKVLAEICQAEMPVTTAEKRAFLLKHHIAVWDVIASCDIAGSADSSIRNVTGNDMNVILKTAGSDGSLPMGIRHIKLFGKYCRQGRPAGGGKTAFHQSGHNAAWSLARLTQVWREAFVLAKSPKPADHVKKETGV